MEKYDFSGWVTKNDLRCSDGRIIRHNAFANNDGAVVPLVWNHEHNGPDNILGKVRLKNKNSGVYGYGTFNDTESASTAKELVKHGDITALSIYANQLKQDSNNVIHGDIKEVSLVLAGANPGAYIDSILMHGDYSDTDAIIYSGEEIELYHAEDNKEKEKEMAKEETKESKSSEKTVKDVFETLTEEQKNAVYALIGAALEDGKNQGKKSEPEKQDDESKEDDKEMKHNVFDTQTEDDTLIHDGLQEIIKDAKRQGSMKESFLVHSQDYGIENIDYLFPDAKNIDNTPQFIQREMGWVQKVMGGVHHTPFSRIKSVFADITDEEARAKGYMKGKLKKEEVFTLLKRTTTPTTIYKKQKMDRDDVIDITDFDVIAWVKSEMRTMLDEEIARAILIGDGRSTSSDDKINEQNIRPILSDADLYTIKSDVEIKSDATGADKAKAFIDQVVRSRKNYKGSGQPSLYTTEDMITECLLLEDQIGHKLYKSEAELATAMRVKEIIPVEVMENLKDSKSQDVAGIVVNLTDYNIGADKGGAVNMFDDFDIDYNRQKYLIETRCSGALIKPYSAIALSFKVGA